MATVDDETEDRSGDALLRAIAWTPQIAPFAGTVRYKVRSCLGEGGFGVVYDVEDTQLGRRVALKTLKPERSGFAANIHRLKREFRAAADLVHPNLVGLHELASDADRWFFTMDLIRGCDFREYVRGESAVAYARTMQRPGHATPPAPDSGTLSEPRLRAALRQLVAGVTALHDAGIIHRDLKPSNVLVEPGGRVVILDFGLAGAETQHDPELASGGTPLYMAPEQASGRAVTAAADWYAVGVMLYEALTGTLPAEDVAPPSAYNKVPADLERLCLELLARDPARRPDARAIAARLTGEAETSAARPADRAGTFVGRAHELAVLRDAYAAVVAGDPRVVRVSGQPGVGKSALLARFFSELRDAGTAVILDGRCYERESVPFKAIDGVVDALVRHLSSLPRNQAAALMPRDIHLVAQLFPALETVAAARDVPRRPAHRADPREQRLSAFAAIKELLARLADKQPLVVAIDDLQWGDVDSARLLAQLVGPPARPNLLLVVCYRADEADHSPTLRETLRMLEAGGDLGIALAIPALAPEDAELLATRLLGDAHGDSDAARTIALRGEGHPLFMSELARALVLADDSETSAPTLVDILWRRVVRLSEHARALLETVAIAGQPIASGLCFDAAGLGASGVDAMRLLRAEQLVRANDTGVLNVFHDRIRDTVLMRADGATQRMRHLALARTIERAAEPDPEVLARHYDAADEREQAARYAVRAGDAAMATLAFDRAAALYRMALERGVATAELHEKHGNALMAAGHNLAAGEAFLAGAPLADGALATDLLRRGAAELLTVGDLDRGYRALELALAAVGERLPKSHRRRMLEMLYHLFRFRLTGRRFRERAAATIPRDRLLRLDVLDSAIKGLDPNDPTLATMLGFRYVRRALAVGEPKRVALALARGVFGYCVGQRDRPAVIDEILEEADAIGIRIGEPEVNANTALMRGIVHFAFGDFPGCAEHFERAISLITERCVGMSSEYRTAAINLASAYGRMGRLAEARRVCDALLLDAEERGDPVAEKNVCAGGFAMLRIAADDVAGADAFIARCKIDDRCISVMVRAETTTTIGAYSGRHGGIEWWRSRWKVLADMGVFMVPGLRTITSRSLGVALLVRDDPRDRREIAKLAGWLRRYTFPYARATASHLRALIAMREDRPDQVQAQLAAAVTDYERAGMAVEAAACRYRIGTLAADASAIPAAADALRAFGIANPERWTNAAVPALAPRRKLLGAG